MSGISLRGFAKHVKHLKSSENVAYVLLKASFSLVCLLSYVFVICMKIYFTILILCSDVIFFRPTGGALKPTDIETLWVHVTCAWFRPEVSFASDEKMEPALGILSIPSNSFVKVDYLFLYIIFYDTSHYIC